VLGVGIGVVGSLALRTVIAGFLFGVAPTDAPTLLGVPLIFVAVAFLSTYIPARRAARIDPTVAVRYE
jgi:putative ABC transport system permease protein